MAPRTAALLALSSPITAGALILDIAGALTLAASFMFKRPRSWREETLTFPGGNYRLMLSLAMQTADAQVGAVLLVLGFGSQLVSSVGVHPGWACFALTVPVAIAIAAGAGLFLLACWRPLNVRRAVADDLAMRTPDEWPPAIEAWGNMIDNARPALMLAPRFARRPAETPKDHAARLIGKRRWESLQQHVSPRE